jgi:hypothetical protein
VLTRERTSACLVLGSIQAVYDTWELELTVEDLSMEFKLARVSVDYWRGVRRIGSGR